MMPGYSYVLTVVVILLISWMALNLMVSNCYLRLRRQRDVLYRAFNDAIDRKLGVYSPLPDDLIRVLDQIEGVKKKKAESEVLS